VTGSKQPSPRITVSEPFPLLDPGTYVALCTEATYAWARQWKKWIARLVLEPLNYQGRPYTGRLCKFLGLGKDLKGPHAGPQSDFRQLLVEVNGAQPTRPDAGMEIFINVLYDIEVATVTTNRDGEKRPPEQWYSVVRKIHPCKDQSKPTLQPANSGPSNSSTLGTQATHSTGAWKPAFIQSLFRARTKKRKRQEMLVL
jgi:hypothetical protein